jgi:hypothetical protein
MQFLVKDLGVDPQRIRVTSAGANEPVSAENTIGNTLQNARVEIMVLEEVVADLRVEDRDMGITNDPASNANSVEKPGAMKSSAEKKKP